MVQTGEASGTRTVALLTSMDEPLGRFSGNWVEVWECVDIYASNTATPCPPTSSSSPTSSPAGCFTSPARPKPPKQEQSSPTKSSAAGEAYKAWLKIVEAQGGDTYRLRRPRPPPQTHRHSHHHCPTRRLPRLHGLQASRLGRPAPRSRPRQTRRPRQRPRRYRDARQTRRPPRKRPAPHHPLRRRRSPPRRARTNAPRNVTNRPHRTPTPTPHPRDRHRKIGDRRIVHRADDGVVIPSTRSPRFCRRWNSLPLVCPLMLGRFCRRLGRLDVAAIIAAGLKVVALLRQVRIKMIENRLVD